MFIVLEGCDNTGKTTLARRLCEKAEKDYDLSTEIWHRGVPRRHPLEEYELDLELGYPFADPKSDDHLIVADRWHLGQYVYGGLYRDNNIFGDSGLWHVDARLRSIGAVQLILDIPTELVIGREYAGKTEDWQVSEDAGYLKMEDVDRVRARYRDCARMFDLPMINPSQFDSEDGLDKLLNSAFVAHEESETTRRAQTYVGPIQPSILLLGERRGFAEAGSLPRGAAFSPYDSTSGRWLIDSFLHLPPELHRSIGLANALEEEDLGDLIEYLYRPQVVALGNIASQHLTKLGIEHGKVPHPQYMRRFKNAQQKQYSEMLRVAASEQRYVRCD